jgi:RNA polymerase subunit RPABC4/transcription elongation factor Spt4
VERRFGFWDIVVAGALALMVAGMCLPWWGFNPTDFLGGLGLSGVDTDLFGMSTEVRGWEAPMAGLGITAIVLNALALGSAALKFSFPARTPLPVWYKQGWLVGALGSLCTLFGVIVCVAAPSGGYVMWNWRPGSALVLGGGVALLVAGVVMARDQSGSYQGAGKVTWVRAASPSFAAPQSAVGAGSSAPTDPSVVSTVVACASCGAVIKEDAVFCPGCGGRVTSAGPETGAASRCTRCEAALTEGAAFCSACGWRV